MVASNCSRDCVVLVLHLVTVCCSPASWVADYAPDTIMTSALKSVTQYLHVNIA